jgi:predicted enzyme related to lactoylglutathione lyase
MKRVVLFAGVAMLGAMVDTVPAEAGQPAPPPPAPAPIVFFDIAGPDMARQASFYRTVFNWDVAKDGRFSAPVTLPLGATLRQDPRDKIIYVGVDDVTATLTKIKAHGGSIVQPRFEVKGVVVLGLFTDPAGNSMGLVELKDGKLKVP